MAIARGSQEARAIVASGRVAVFLGCESGIDHEGDIEVLGAMHRLGLRTIQFATQSGYNAFSDSALAPLQGAQPTDTYKGINERGRALVREMNRLGVLIDITHGTDAVQAQLIEASRAPVVASHDTLRGVYGGFGYLGRDPESPRRQGRAGRHPRRRAGGRPALSTMDGGEAGGENAANAGGGRYGRPRAVPRTGAGRSRRIHRALRRGIP